MVTVPAVVTGNALLKLPPTPTPQPSLNFPVGKAISNPALIVAASRLPYCAKLFVPTNNSGKAIQTVISLNML